MRSLALILAAILAVLVLRRPARVAVDRDSADGFSEAGW
jgi:hypothetical protein